MEISRRIKFLELPEVMRLRLNESEFIRATLALDGVNFIAWIVRDGKRFELEWSPEKADFLSDHERLSKKDEGREFELARLGVRADVRYRLDEKTNSLIEDVFISSIGLGDEISRIEQNVYSPTRLPVDQLVSRELGRVNFPSLYAKWPIDQKTNYWVSSLYRLRRSVGEDGRFEDEAFGPELIARMLQVDSNISAILPLVIKGLAMMEGGGAEVLAESFSRRTGYSVKI